MNTRINTVVMLITNNILYTQALGEKERTVNREIE